ncbi:hypothetical protein Ocin01_05821 [Orchesella cincta]|uniref:Uncharacterized protein n=1 Tax=Orchesella cincta TaxID=48709 RepID=A0A1D2N6L1_ORCCI|nr:hypothetical protein Ocin01_05821 [Orchesella cincta]
MGHVGHFLISLLIVLVAVSANGAAVDEKTLSGNQRFQNIVDNYLQDFYEHINYTRSYREDVDVFAKRVSTGFGGNQISLQTWNRSKATEFDNRLVKSEEDKGESVEPKKEMEIENGDVNTLLSYNYPTSPPPIESKFLNPKSKPSSNFTVNSNIMYRFDVDKGMSYNRQYFISVVVEKMSCATSEENAGQKPILSIKGERTMEIQCVEFDSSYDRFQSVPFTFDGEKQVTIQGIGDWLGASASLVASLYYETSNGCNSCTLNHHFCCGSTHDICRFSSSSDVINKECYRCIPREQNGSSLLCDLHPNCGMVSNRDESDKDCSKDGEGDYSACYTCRDVQNDRFLLTILLLIVFCVFVPFCIFLVFCSRKDVRRELGQAGRCPLPLEILFCPFSMNSDNEARVERNAPRQRRNPRRPARRSEEGQNGQENFSYFDDLPPPYSECCNNKCMYPNPQKFPQHLGTTLPLQHTSSSSSGSRTVPTVSLQVLTISSLINERSPPSFEVVVAERSSNDRKKKTQTSNNASAPGVNNVLTQSQLNPGQAP